jgi:hypothetical protein
MSNVVQLSTITNLTLLGTRFLARKLRASIEHALAESGDVVIDFTGIEVTQSFVDELVGPLLLKDGPSILSKMAFRGCSENAQAVIGFVVSERLADHSSEEDRKARGGKLAHA